MNNYQIDENKPGISPQQKELLKKYAVFAIMGIIFAGCMYLIFSPSGNENAKQELSAGFNADIPLPRDEVIIDDKRQAYEQEQIRQRQDERMRSLQDFTALLGENAQNDNVALTLFNDEPQTRQTGGSAYTPQNRQQAAIQQSAQTYHDINRTLGSFYETPREDPEKERMRTELEELQMRLDETENRKNSVNEHLELMEKSFQMAARYMPTGTAETVGINEANIEPAPVINNASGKTAVVPVTQARTQTVSALLPEMSDAEFIEIYSRPRNMSFLTATNETNAVTKNTVSACIYSDQTVMDGQNVRLRLLEQMQAGNVVIPRNTLLTGTARIQGERLGITVNSLEYRGMIMPVGLRVYDLDGLQGIFIPNMAELNAAKEIVANMGTAAGTSITLSNDAGKQFAADMGRNAIQGVSQFTAKKLREVKVNLKDGYRLFMISE